MDKEKLKKIAEEIRAMTEGYINEHGMNSITDDDEDSFYKKDIIDILESNN